MPLSTLFPAERVFVEAEASSRESLLKLFAQRAAELGLVDRQICLEALTDREALGSTGLGNGIAIPHARIEGLDQPVGMIATLARPIDFEAVDQEPVDIAIMVLMPAHSGSEQMKVLSRVAKFARDEPAMNALRRASSVPEAAAVIAEAD